MLRRSRILALLLVTAAAAAPLFAADTYTIDRVHSTVGFTVRHFASRVHGSFGDFEGTIQADTARPEASSVVLTIKSTSIDTRNEKRDGDLRSENFFDVAKFPEIAFKSTKIAPTGKDTYAVTGTFTMHGVTKEITLPVTYLGSMKDPWGNERASFSLSTKLNRKDYGINWNKALDNGSLMLSDEVEITIDLETIKKKPEAPAAK